jgi:tetratricopeptide (TPR) repeat protein
MYRNESRWLAAIAIGAAVSATSFAVVAQTSTSEVSANRPTLTTIVAPVAQPTPEAVGDSLMAHRRYQAAIAAYKQAPQNSAAVWNKMGIAYQMLFNLQDATRCYEESLKRDAKNSNVLNNLGTVYDSEREYKAAVKMYHKALKIDGKSALVLKNLGTDLLAQHQYKKGWEAYKQALALDPQIFDRNNGPRVENPASVQDRGAMNYYMAKGCVRAGENERAIQYLRMALNEGFTSPKKIAADEEFAGLHGLPAFTQLMAEQQKSQ